MVVEAEANRAEVARVGGARASEEVGREVPGGVHVFEHWEEALPEAGVARPLQCGAKHLGRAPRDVLKDLGVGS